MKVFEIDEETMRSRLDVFVAAKYPDYARTALVRLIDAGEILVNDEDSKPGYKLKYGDKVSVDISTLDRLPDVVELPVLYEDANVIVIDKPVGIIAHSRSKFWFEASVASFVRARVSASMTGERAGIVHRLDRATSGVMLCAKNQDTLSFVQKQFSDRKVEKTYFAVVEGRVEPEEAIIDMPIDRNPKLPSTFRVASTGKSAQTHYKVMEQGNGFTLLKLTPKTGRTHQLRVHLQYQKHPIVGDKLYGGKEAERLFLHAHELTLNVPEKGMMTFSSPVPHEFMDLLTGHSSKK